MTTAPKHRERQAASSPDQPDTRERVLRATAALLAHKGYGQTRLSAVAASAGLQPSAIYYYFESRDALVAAVMTAGQERVRTQVESAIAAQHDGGYLNRINAAVEAHLRTQCELSDFAAAVSRNAAHVPASIRRVLDRDSEAYHSMWRDLLHDAQLSGEIRSDLDLAVTRMLIIGALNWSVDWWTADHSADRMVATAQTMVWAALASPTF